MDIPAILQLLEQCGLRDTALTEERFAAMLAHNRGFYFVAKTDAGELMGSICGMHDGGMYGYIYKLAIAEPFRHHGLACALMETVERAFQAAGIFRVFGHVHHHNGASRGVCSRMGFQPRTTHLLVDKDYC